MTLIFIMRFFRRISLKLQTTKVVETATVIPLPKKRPPESIENDIRPIALTPILAKVFESIVVKWVDNNIIIPQIDDKQFGGMARTGTTDALVEMLHTWYEATDEPGTTVRMLFMDYSKAFDLINHDTLIDKLVAMNLPAHYSPMDGSFSPRPRTNS